MLQPDSQALDFFEANVRKERRGWDIVSDFHGTRVLRFTDGVTQIFEEVATLRYLAMHAPRINFPDMEFRSRNAISLAYINGVRGDTAFDALKSACIRKDESASRAAAAFFAKLKLDLAVLHNVPVNPALSHKKYAVTDKLTRDALEFLRIAPNTSISLSALSCELDQLANDYEALCSRPFRDPNPKNCIVQLPKDVDITRARADLDYLASTLTDLFERVPAFFEINTYQLDFSGWATLVPEFDDPIMLHTHRSTMWLPNSITAARDLPWKDRDFLVTAFVRHFRLTVRRLFYQLLNSEGYKMRYGRDPSSFYANVLKHLTRALQKTSNNEYASTLQMVYHMIALVKHVPDVDFYLGHKGIDRSIVYYDGFLEALT